MQELSAQSAMALAAELIVNGSPAGGILVSRFEMGCGFFKCLTVYDWIHQDLDTLDLKAAKIVIIPEHPVHDGLRRELPVTAADAALIKSRLQVFHAGAGDMHPEDFPDSLGSLRIDDQASVFRAPLVSDRDLSRRDFALFGALPDPAGDLLPEIRAVVFRQTFQQRLEEDALRTVWDAFLRIVQRDAGLPEADLIDGDVLTAAPEAVDLPRDDAVEGVAIRVMHHPEELVTAFGTGAGDMPVRIDADDIYIVLRSVGLAICDLPFDGLIGLPGPFAVSRVYNSSIYFLIYFFHLIRRPTYAVLPASILEMLF